MDDSVFFECQICGQKANAILVALEAKSEADYWVTHLIRYPGYVVAIMTCPECHKLSEETILARFKTRIRQGFITGFH